jgi:peptidyl-prolyl cis-trans isomerase C
MARPRGTFVRPKIDMSRMEPYRMTRIFATTAVLTGAVAISACEGVGQAMSSHTDVLARAAGHELSVEEASRLLIDNPNLPAQADVVEALANIWIDYTLLAEAMVADSTLGGVPLEDVIQPQLDAIAVQKLREEVIDPDTSLTEEELRARFEEQRPGLEVRARHVLLQLGPDASPEARDSVEAQIEDIRARAAAGEDFTALASTYSQDPGSAQRGGDLGFFARGAMVAPFETAAFALQPGEVSPVVRTDFGYHVIKVEERREPSYAERRDAFAQSLKTDIVLETEQAFVDSLMESREIEVLPEAPDIVRELAREPDADLSARRRSRPLVSYRGGAYTVGDLATLMLRVSPLQLAQLAGASDEDMETVLEGLAQNKILIEAARAAGHEPTPVEADSILDMARRMTRNATVAIGIEDMSPVEGEDTRAMIDRAVLEALGETASGRRNVPQFGALSHALRQGTNARVFMQAADEVIRLATEARATAGADSAAPPTPPGGQVPTRPQPEGGAGDSSGQGGAPDGR